jgi:hypothetical protein
MGFVGEPLRFGAVEPLSPLRPAPVEDPLQAGSIVAVAAATAELASNRRLLRPRRWSRWSTVVLRGLGQGWLPSLADRDDSSRGHRANRQLVHVLPRTHGPVGTSAEPAQNLLGREPQRCW